MRHASHSAHRHSARQHSNRHNTHRRLLAALLCAAALLASACSSDGNGDDTAGGNGAGDNGDTVDLPPCPLEALEEATGPVEVVVWHGYVAKTEETLQDLVARYNAEQDRVVVRLENQGTYLELWQKYLGAVPSRNLPAIAIPDDTVTLQMIDSGTVLPAQSCIEASDADVSSLLPAVRAYYTVDDVLYPGTLNVGGPLLYYNRGHFRAAGLDPDVTPETLDEVREFAQQIKDEGVVDVPVVLNVSSPLIETLLTGAGVPLIDNDNGRGGGETTEALLDGDDVAALLQWIRDMQDDGLLEVVPLIDGQVAHYLAMASQSSSMTIETSTAATSIEAFLGGDLDVDDVTGAPGDVPDVDVQGLDIGAGPIPGINEPGRLQMGGGAWYITNTTSPEVQAAAWDFISWFNEVPQQVTWTLEGSYLPFNMDAVDDPAVVAAWSDRPSGQWLAIAWQEVTEGLDPDFPGPLLGPYDEMRVAIRRAVDSVAFAGTDPATALAEADDLADEAIDEYRLGF